MEGPDWQGPRKSGERNRQLLGRRPVSGTLLKLRHSGHSKPENKGKQFSHFIGKQTEAWRIKGLKVSYFRSLGSTLSQNLGFKVSPFLAETEAAARSRL